MNKFKVGDVVKVIRKVESQNGWNNSWIDDMDDAIGKVFTIQSIIDKYDVYFKEVDYGYPTTALKLVSNDKSIQSDKKPQNPTKFNIDRGLKYQYFNENDYSLTIATHIRRNAHGDAIVDWSVAFKHPKDKFSKQIAREIISTKETKRLFVAKNYTRNLIVAKILGDLLYNEENLSVEYRKFIIRLLQTTLYDLVWELD